MWNSETVNHKHRWTTSTQLCPFNREAAAIWTTQETIDIPWDSVCLLAHLVCRTLASERCRRWSLVHCWPLVYWDDDLRRWVARIWGLLKLVIFIGISTGILLRKFYISIPLLLGRIALVSNFLETFALRDHCVNWILLNINLIKKLTNEFSICTSEPIEGWSKLS